MKKTRVWIALALVLVFLAGVVAGIFVERWFLAKKPELRRGGNTERYPSHERWAKELGLTDEQQAKIREIFKKNDERIKELRTDFFKHVGEMRDTMKKEIDAVLTPEQKQKMEAMIQKYMEQRRKDYDKRDKRNDSPNRDIPPKEKRNEKENSHRSGDPSGNRGSHAGSWPF